MLPKLGHETVPLVEPSAELFHVYGGLFIFPADIGLAVYFLADIRLHNFQLRFV